MLNSDGGIDIKEDWVILEIILSNMFWNYYVWRWIVQRIWKVF